MSYYECVFIARQDLSQTQAEALAEVYSRVLSENNGKVVNDEYWGLRNLAYPIKKNKRGHYIMLNIDAPSEAVQEMERQMRFNEDIIRYLSIKVDELSKEPSVMMRHPKDRDGFDRRGGDKHRKTDATPKTEVKDGE